MRETIIKIEGVSKKFGENVGVEDLSISINKGEIFGYLGENGAGKTTTIRLLTGLLKPDSGNIDVLGSNPLSNNNIRRDFSCVLDTNGLYESLTIEENLIFYSNIYGIKKEDAKKVYLPLLEKFNIIDRKKDKVGKLSKGMKQKTALIRSLSVNPKIMFLDEPTAGLDPLSQKKVREVIKKYASYGITMFFSSHNLNEVEEICDRVGILKNGKLIIFDTITNLFKRFGNKILEIKVDNIEKAISIIKNKYSELGLYKEKDILKINNVSEELISEINKTLVLSDILVKHISMEKVKLEDIYRVIME